jgi:hypothetical protein
MLAEAFRVKKTPLMVFLILKHRSLHSLGIRAMSTRSCVRRSAPAFVATEQTGAVFFRPCERTGAARVVPSDDPGLTAIAVGGPPEWQAGRTEGSGSVGRRPDTIAQNHHPRWDHR